MTVETGAAEWPAYQVRTIQRWSSGHFSSQEDCIAEEAPVALVYNGEPHVVMLATPLDLEDFAIGFSLTEGIVEAASDIENVRIFHRSNGIEIRIRVPEERCESIADKGRNLTGRTGCGLCGARTLAQAVKPPRALNQGVTVDAVTLETALAELRSRQRLNQMTGAIHAAAWVLPEQGIQLVREDVGRHNALDKLIGALAPRKTDFQSGFVVVTSRASYEMVQKCVSVGITFLAAISAPTGLAIRYAQSSGFTLVGFARDRSHVVYANPARLVHPLENPVSQ